MPQTTGNDGTAHISNIAQNPKIRKSEISNFQKIRIFENPDRGGLPPIPRNHEAENVNEPIFQIMPGMKTIHTTLRDFPGEIPEGPPGPLRGPCGDPRDCLETGFSMGFPGLIGSWDADMPVFLMDGMPCFQRGNYPGWFPWRVFSWKQGDFDRIMGNGPPEKREKRLINLTFRGYGVLYWRFQKEGIWVVS